MIHITLEDAQSAMWDAVKLKGKQYVYTNPKSYSPAPKCYCVYMENEEVPSCIVGHVLKSLGVDGAWLLATSGGILGIAKRAERAGEFTIDKDALKFLFVAQVAQDSGAPWGSAHSTADAVARFDSSES
jgi:hypothetical protein